MKRMRQLLVTLAGGGLLSLAAQHGGAYVGAGEKNTSAAPAEAAAIYAKRCATCHGKDGRAKTWKGKLKGARNLADAEWQAQTSDERIYNSVANGREGGMPSFKKKLSGAEIEALVGYVRSLKK